MPVAGPIVDERPTETSIPVRNSTNSAANHHHACRTREAQRLQNSGGGQGLAPKIQAQLGRLVYFFP
jgi:hypothetical protein